MAKQDARLNDPDYWKARAKEARCCAEQMTTELARQQMLQVALDYDKLAERAEERRKLWRERQDYDERT